MYLQPVSQLSAFIQFVFKWLAARPGQHVPCVLPLGISSKEGDFDIFLFTSGRRQFGTAIKKGTSGILTVNLVTHSKVRLYFYLLTVRLEQKKEKRERRRIRYIPEFQCSLT